MFENSGKRNSEDQEYRGSNSLGKAYRRNGIILVVSGLAIIISMIAGQMCVPENTKIKNSEISTDISKDLRDKYTDFLFETSIISSEGKSRVEISVIRPSNVELPSGIIAEIEKIAYSNCKLKEGLLIINFYIRMKTLGKEDVLAFDSSEESNIADIYKRIENN